MVPRRDANTITFDCFHEPHVSTLVYAYYPGSLGGIERGGRGQTCSLHTNSHYYLSDNRLDEPQHMRTPHTHHKVVTQVLGNKENDI